MARGNRRAEIKEGKKVQEEIITRLNEYFSKKDKKYTYADNGELSLIDYTIYGSNSEIVAFLEVKSRNISSKKYGDIILILEQTSLMSMSITSVIK